MAIALDDRWIWDSWYAHDGERWHGYFLQAPRAIQDPELRHFNVSYGHAISDNLVDWEHLGTCFAPSPHTAWDDYTTWTGSVIEHEGLWHLFYTGSSQAEKGMVQRIGHAISENMHDWKRVGDGLCLDLEGPLSALYDRDLATTDWHDRAMRDPWVMKDPDGPGWLMFFTARTPGASEPNDGGAIGFATSENLYDWVLQPPVYQGGFGQLEVPQVFQHGHHWYCLFCTDDTHFSKPMQAHIPGGPVTGTHYLMADHPRGPWRLPPGGFLDGSTPNARYAARILNHQNQLCLLGFAARPDGHTFLGYVMDPHTVHVDDNGILSLAQTPTG